MKTVLLAGAFLLSSSFLVAQNQAPASTPPTLPQSQSQPAPDQQPSASPSSTMPAADQSSMGSQSDSSAQKIEGCLAQSGSDFTLADASGTTYKLTGETSKLSSHVGEQVEVKGSPAADSSAASSAAPSTSDNASAASTSASGASASEKSFTVQSVKRIAKSCSNAQPKQ
jgi:hypothetical protein